MQWPDATSGGLEGVSNEKVPTELQYDGHNYKWGYQIREDEQRHQWFKLGLDPAQIRSISELARQFPDPMAAPPGYDTTPEKLVTDYLTALRKHAEQILRYKLPSSAIQSLPIEFIVSLSLSMLKSHESYLALSRLLSLPYGRMELKPKPASALSKQAWDCGMRSISYQSRKLQLSML